MSGVARAPEPREEPYVLATKYHVRLPTSGVLGDRGPTNHWAPVLGGEARTTDLPAGDRASSLCVCIYTKHSLKARCRTVRRDASWSIGPGLCAEEFAWGLLRARNAARNPQMGPYPVAKPLRM